VNIMKNRLVDQGLQVGPWLTELRLAVIRKLPDDAPFRVWWRQDGILTERTVCLGDLKREILSIVPGQKISYVTDVLFSNENVTRILELARGSDYLFIETPFLHEDTERAAGRYHLTAYQAGVLARKVGAVRILPFHFSPRYTDREGLLREELAEGFDAQ
jgi:ribonuclease Z